MVSAIAETECDWNFPFSDGFMKAYLKEGGDMLIEVPDIAEKLYRCFNKN